MKNVGRYPDRDTSLVHRGLTDDRLAEVSMTDEQIISTIDSLTHNYVTPDQVDARTQGKLWKSDLAYDANLYIDQSDVGTNYASLVNGKIPTSQLPNHPTVNFLETGERYYTTSRPTVGTSSAGRKTAVGTITIGNPGYSWMPIIYGTVEVNSLGTPPTIITVEDSSNRVVAGGLSSRASNYNRVVISPESIPTGYLNGWTFTFYLWNRDGGSSQTTSFQRSIHYFPVPWAPANWNS